MILEEETFEAFGYCPSELPLQSNKCILVACDECNKVRETSKNAYRSLCRSCAKKGKRNFMFNNKHTDKAKALMSTAATLRIGDKNPHYKGGRKLSIARKNAKRRELKYILLMPLAEGEEGHHITNEYVIGVPKEVHRMLSGTNNRRKHRTLVLQWLKANDKKKYLKVLCVLAKQ